MLKILRHKGVAKKVLWFVAVIIIFSFGFMGQAYLLRDRANTKYAGSISGKKVSLEEFQRNYTLTAIQAMLQYGQEFDKIRPYLNLEGQTWDRIILLRAASKRKIKVPDPAVVQTIQNYDFFKRDGHFDQGLYQDILQHVFRISARDYEEGVRENLMFTELFEQETFGLTVSEEEILQAYTFENEKVQVSYVLVEDDLFKDAVTFDEVKAKTYYQEHQQDFLRPPSINVEYIQIDIPRDETADLAMETAEKDEPPADRAAELPEEEEPPENPATEAARSKALDIAYEIGNGGELTEIAQRFGLEVKTTGFFSKENPIMTLGWSFPTMEKIFQLQPGQASELFETPQGFQIVRVLEQRPAYIPEYAETADEVKIAWIESEAHKLAGQKAREHLAAIKGSFSQVKHPDFSKTAKDLDLALAQTPLFQRGEYLPVIGISRDFQDAAFALTETEPLADGIIDSAKGWGILFLDQKQPIDQDAYEKEKAGFSEKLLGEKKNAAFAEFVTRLKLQTDLNDLVSKRKARAPDNN